MPPEADEDLDEDLAERAHVIQELLWIYGTDTHERIAHRLGYSSIKTLQRTLSRWGHPEIAKLLTHHTLNQNKVRM